MHIWHLRISYYVHLGHTQILRICTCWESISPSTSVIILTKPAWTNEAHKTWPCATIRVSETQNAGKTIFPCMATWCLCNPLSCSCSPWSLGVNVCCPLGPSGLVSCVFFFVIQRSNLVNMFFRGGMARMFYNLVDFPMQANLCE